MLDDTGTNHGIIVSSGGFTKTAYNRISHLHDKVTLETIPWEQAYKVVEESHSYHLLNDICSICLIPEEYGKSVPGLLLWEHGLGLVKEQKVCVFSYGICLR